MRFNLTLDCNEESNLKKILKLLFLETKET